MNNAFMKFIQTTYILGHNLGCWYERLKYRGHDCMGMCERDMAAIKSGKQNASN
jgi:hypothetical protein